MATINDIKKQALALMFTNYDDNLLDVYHEDVDLYNDEEYTQYLHNMNWSINRCLQRFESVDALPLGKVEFPYDEQGESFYARKTIEDLKSVERVIYEDGKRYEGNIDFMKEGKDIVLKTLKSGKYIILYHPIAPYISPTAPSSTEIDLPNALTTLIPLFIKAELFEEDEPALATQSRNIFEQMLADYLRSSEEDHRQIRVVDAYV